MKKQMLALLLVFLMIFTNTACVSENEPPANEPPTNVTPSNEAPASEVAPTGEIVTVEIGAIYPMTGAAAKTGAEYIATMQLAIDIINNVTDIDLPYADSEGIVANNGVTYKLHLNVGDHQASPEIGMSEAERLIGAGCHLLMGCHYSSVAKTASNTAERMGIPFIIPDSTSPDLTERGFEWVFRTGPTDDTFVADTFKYLQALNEAGANIRTVAMVAEDTEFGALLGQRVERQYADYGFELVEYITYPANSTSVTAEVLKLLAADPDAVIMASYTSDTILFINEFADKGFNPQAIVGQRAGFIAPELFEAIGDKAETLSTTNVWSLDLANSNPVIGEVNAMLNEVAGVDFTGDYARAFTAIFALADVLQRTKSLEPADLQAALQATDIPNNGNLIVPWQGIKFDEKGQNIYASGIVTQVFDGKYLTVWPTDNASKTAVFPIAGW